MTSLKLSWALTFILAIMVTVMGYLFIIRGSTLEASDGRTALLMNEHERDHILGEMRGLLEAVQAITEGLVEGDMDKIAEEATAVGMVLARDEDPALIAKLPLDFKANGFAAHAAFDQLAANARDFGDKDMILEELSVILSACTACHAGYRVALEDS